MQMETNDEPSASYVRQSTTNFDNNEDVNNCNLDFGDPDYECSSCGAIMWYQERNNKNRNCKNLIFTLCCGGGKVKLPLLNEPPELLKNLLFGSDSRSKHFIENIRSYNTMFSFTSMGGKMDNKFNDGNGPYVFRISGQNFHRIGSLLPIQGTTPKFAQLYIYDTENEVSNKISAIRSKRNGPALDPSIVDDLKNMLDSNNVLVQSFRLAKDRIDSAENRDIKLRLIGGRNNDGRCYNLPSVSEVAGLIVGDIGLEQNFRDIIVETQNGQLRRINELHPAYLPMQYPLLFPYGEDGYRRDVLLTEIKKERERQ